MQTYSEMVDSGVDWIGEIPKGWRLRRFSRMIKVQKGKKVDALGDGLPILDMSYLREGGEPASFGPKETEERYRVKDDDLLVLWDGSKAGEFIKARNGVVGSTLASLKSDISINDRYLFYLAKAQEKYLQDMTNGMGIPHVDRRILMSLIDFRLDFRIQQKIADFLDTEIAQIDKLIAKQERLLELLEEKRRATITHAVTRGLDPHVELKETNIPWLGQVPVHWELYRAKYLFEKIQEKPLDTDEVVTAFRDGEVVLRSLRREDGFTFADKEIGYQHVSVGDLVIHAMDAFAGAVGVSKSEGKMSPVCSICRPIRSGVDTEYYAQLVRAMTSTNYLVAIAKGIRERSTDFRFGDFSNMAFPLPPLDEQRGIISRINDENEKVAKLKQKIQTQITLLRERRTSLISHAVTGKIKI